MAREKKQPFEDLTGYDDTDEGGGKLALLPRRGEETLQ